MPSHAAKPRLDKADKAVEYRKTAGEAIAPTVISDDPPPTSAPPSTEGASQREATLNGDPNGITRDTLNAAVQRQMDSFASCFPPMDREPAVSVSFDADPSGYPRAVRVNGGPASAEYCIRQVVQGIRYPIFEGKGVHVDLPLSFHRTTTPGSENRQGSTPPALFMEP